MNPRLAAAKALTAVLNGKASLNSSLPTQLDKVEDRDRGFTQDLAFGTARWQPRLSALAAKLLQKPFKAADRDVATSALGAGARPEAGARGGRHASAPAPLRDRPPGGWAAPPDDGGPAGHRHGGCAGGRG